MVIYFGKYVRTIIKLFKNMGVNSTIQNTKIRQFCGKTQSDRYETGIHELTCLDSQKSYIGQL